MNFASQTPEISAVVVARNEGEHVHATVRQLLSTLPEDSEIIVVDDGSTDDCVTALSCLRERVRCARVDSLGVTKARNHGAQLSVGEVIVFCDAHLGFQPGWWEPMVSLLRDARVGAVSPCISAMGNREVRGFGLRIIDDSMTAKWLPRQQASPYPVPIVPGCCLAIRRETFACTEGFDAGMMRWGMSDIEFSLRLWLLGFEQWVIPEVDVAHLFRSKHPYPVEWIHVLHNTLRTAFLHLRNERIVRVIDRLKHRRDFAAAMTLAAMSDCLGLRQQLAARRIHDDDWYFESFKLPAPEVRDLA